MEISISNKSINLASINENHAYINDFNFHIIWSDKSDNGSPILTLSTNQQLGLLGVNWMNAGIFSIFRLILYKFLIERYKIKQFTPINVLILLTCVLQHLDILVGLVFQTTIVSSGLTLEDLRIPWTCLPLRIILLFVMSYSVLGGFGIAIYRMLLIKYDILIKEKVGEKRLLGIILFFQALVIAVCLGAQNNIGRITIRPKCMGLPYGHVLDILDMYKISLGDNSVIVFQTSLHLFMASMFLFITIAELIIYIIFFRHLYKHDNNERLRKVLDAEIINKRNTRNAVSFFSHFCSFVAEILFTIGFMIAIKRAKNDHLIFLICLNVRWFTLSIIAMIEVITSNNLRRILCNFIKR